MRIGMLLPSGYALDNPGDGRRMQAYKQAAALEAIGHEVLRLDAWHTVGRQTLDVVHVFEGGFGNYVSAQGRERDLRKIVLAPFIDSNSSFFSYRMASQLHLGSRLMSAQYVLRSQAKHSDLVIARSQHERERFIRSLGIPPHKIAIVLNGVDPPAESADPDTIRKTLNLPERFILHISMYTEGRKNVLRLVEATEHLKLPLIIAGTATKGPTLDALQARTSQSQGRVRLMAYLDRPTLMGLYAACDVFALPSTHEGTGLAALEAASLGAKVVITKHGGPPDYFGHLAEYVDPASLQDMIRGLKAAWDRPRSPELQEHVRNLSWENSARQLVEAYAK